MDKSKLTIGLLDKVSAEKAMVSLSISPDWQKKHRLCFLEANGRVPALTELLAFSRRSKADMKKLCQTIKLQLASNDLLRNPKRVKAGSKEHQKGVIELKGGHGRLFCFFSKNGELIICTNTI